jgi:hypothetical protein
MKYRHPILMLTLFWVPLCQGAVVAATGRVNSPHAGCIASAGAASEHRLTTG